MKYVCPAVIENGLHSLRNGEIEAVDFDTMFRDNSDHERFSVYATQYFDLHGNTVDTYEDDMTPECTYCGRTVIDLEYDEDWFDVVSTRTRALGYDLDSLCASSDTAYPSREQHWEDCDECNGPANVTAEDAAPLIPPPSLRRFSLHAQWAASEIGTPRA